jgi:hypothetical protein
VYAAAAELDHDEHVAPAQEDDVAGEDRVGQRGKELAQVGPDRCEAGWCPR